MTPPLDGYTVPLVGAALPTAPMRPLRTPTIVASVAIGASTLLTLTSAALVLAGTDLGTRTAPTGPAIWLLLLGIPIGITALVATLSWFYRALFNVHMLPDAHPRWSSGWAIAAWFIPLANLVLVPLVAADTARNTVPPQDHGKRRMLTLLAVVWWLGYGGSTLLNTANDLLLFEGTAALVIEGVSLLLRTLSAPTLIVLMVWVTRLQEARFALGVAAPLPVIHAEPMPEPVPVPPPPAPADPPPKAAGPLTLRSAAPGDR